MRKVCGVCDAQSLGRGEGVGEETKECGAVVHEVAQVSQNLESR